MQVHTIGHSNHDLGTFVELLRAAGIDAVADVRSAPWSRYAAQFNQEPLRTGLADAGITYAFLGHELGGRPTDPDCYGSDGHVLYDVVATKPWFRAGLERLRRGAAERHVAVMCSEGDPADCHRHRLIARVLTAEGAEVVHLLPDHTTITAAELFERQRPPVTLFGEQEMTWRSVRSVSPATAQRSSSPS